MYIMYIMVFSLIRQPMQAWQWEDLMIWTSTVEHGDSFVEFI